MPCCLVSLILALNMREVFQKPALCIKHQVICAKQRAQQQLFTCELAGKGSGIMYVKNWLILSYCRSHIHYAAVLYILFLEISYLCISVFVTLTHCYVRNVTEEIDQPLLRCCHISWNEWLKSFEASLLQSSKSKLEGFIHSWIFPSEELFYLYTAKFFKDVEDTCLQNKADHVLLQFAGEQNKY